MEPLKSLIIGIGRVIAFDRKEKTQPAKDRSDEKIQEVVRIYEPIEKSNEKMDKLLKSMDQ